MALSVSVMVACTGVERVGVPGPGSLTRQVFSLEGVRYVFPTDGPAAERPYAFEHFWLYVRVQRSSFAREAVCPLYLRLLAIDRRGRRSVVSFPWEDRTPEPYQLTDLRLRPGVAVACVALSVSGIVFPDRGLYELRLVRPRSEPTWTGHRWRALGWTHLVVE